MSPKTALLVSNGYGEDGIAAKLGQALRRQNVSVFGAPIVGAGLAYQHAGIPTISETPIPPSGGFIRTLSELRRDLQAGVLGRVLQSRRQIQSTPADAIVAVGDVFGYLLSRRAGTPIYFLPTAKSDRFMPHSWIEKWLIKRWATGVYPRDIETTNALAASGIPAWFFGNPMMDGLVVSPLPASTARTQIAILPGSRHDAMANLNMVIALTRSWPISFDATVAVSPTLAEAAINARLQTANGPTQSWQTSTDFATAVGRSDCVIGLAGTANEQAIWLGKPVVTVVGNGPQTTRVRLNEQRRLLGERLIIADRPEADAVFRAFQHALSLPAIPLPPVQSAADAIASHLVTTL